MARLSWPIPARAKSSPRWQSDAIPMPCWSMPGDSGPSSRVHARVIDIADPARIRVIGTVATQVGARTGALDPRDGRIYLPTATLQAPGRGQSVACRCRARSSCSSLRRALTAARHDASQPDLSQPDGAPAHHPRQAGPSRPAHRGDHAVPDGPDPARDGAGTRPVPLDAADFAPDVVLPPPPVAGSIEEKADLMAVHRLVERLARPQGAGEGRCRA
jgi:hypothetical protein